MADFNEEKFLQLYDDYVGKIYRYIYFRVCSEDLAKDLTSEVFLKSWQYFNKPKSADNYSLAENRDSDKKPAANRQIENPRAFIYQVARNIVADFYRQKDRAPISLDEIADKSIADKIADKYSDPVRQSSISLDMHAVMEALANLELNYQEIIIWRYLDELEIKEIANLLEKSEGAVRTMLCRALTELKQIMRTN